MTICLEEKKSTHPVEIVPVELLPHGNADSLSIIPVFGYTYVAKTADWQGITRAAYIPPDSLVDVSQPWFHWLAPEAKNGKYRVKAKKLRGVVSFGLMVPMPDDTPLGDDWAERLGVEHYEPPVAGEARGKGPATASEEAVAPAIATTKYDLDNFRRHHELFVPGEPVVVTEKLDGANSRFVYLDGQMHVGSRSRWVREFPDYSAVTVESLVAQGVEEEKAAVIVAGLAGRPPKRNIWWQALKATPGLERLCTENPGTVVYGEVYGQVNCIKYFDGPNRFAGFDVMQGGVWLGTSNALGMMRYYDVPAVPRPHNEPIAYDFDLVCKLAEGETLVKDAKPGTIREGVVVSPVEERWDPRLGRVKMKVVSGAYLEKYR